MATSGSCQASHSYITSKLSWSQSGQSVAGNYTDINWNLTLSRTYSISSSQNKPYSVTINGVTVASGSTSISGSGTKTVASGTTRIYHNNDGSKSFGFGFSQTLNINYNGYVGTLSASGSSSLNTIARYATVTGASDFNDEENPSVTFTNPAGFPLCLKIEAGGNSNLVLRDKATTISPYTFSLTEDERNMLREKCPNSITLPVRFTVGTYINGTIANWSYVDRKMSIINGNPTAEMSIVDTSETAISLTGSNKKFIKHVSKPNVLITAEAKKYASISSYEIVLDDGQVSNINNCIFETIENNGVVATTKDSRGLSVVNEAVLDLIEYVPLDIVNCYLERPEETSTEATLNINGMYFNNTFGAISNELLIKYRFRENGSEIWGDYIKINPILNNNTFIYSQIIGNSFDYKKEYIFEVVLNDKIKTITKTVILPKGYPVVEIGDEYVNINGELFINNVKILGYEIVDEW